MLARALSLVAIIAVAYAPLSCGGSKHQRTAPPDKKNDDDATAAMSTGELREALSRAGAEKRITELAVIASALEARGEMDEATLVKLIDSLGHAELAAFAKGAAKGTRTADLVARRTKMFAAHVGRETKSGGRLAVLLPLSGPHAAIGNEFRAAIELASKDASVSVVFIDTKGTEEGAQAAVTAAASKHRARAILGPVGERESRAAAAKAALLGLSIGLLSPEETGASPEAGIFRLWPSREHEAAEAAAIAVALGYSAPAVLAPRDELGAAAAKAFVEAAKKAGATQVRSGFYEPSATELEPDLKAFLGLVPLNNPRLRRHLRRKGRKKGWKSFSPDVDFDLLFIPDTYDRAALVAAYLPFFNVELRADEIVDTMSLRRKHGGRIPSVVQLMGSHEWHHPSLIARGGSAIEGALIVEACVGGANEDYIDDDSARLATRLRRAIGRPPSRVASQAYDAAKLVFDRFRGGRRGSALFVGAKSKTGACGPSFVDASGQLRRESVLLRVEGEELLLHEW